MRICKYIIAFIFVFISILNASGQSYIGVTGGMGGGNVRFLPFKETKFYGFFPNGGISYKYYGKMKYAGGIQADLLYVTKGYSTLPYRDADTINRRTINAIELPFMWQPHINLFKDRARFALNLGVYFSYAISSDTSSYSVKDKKDIWGKGEYKYMAVRDNRFEYGLVAGAAIAVNITRRVEIVGEFRYVFGYSDIFKNRNKYPTNPLRSPIDQMRGSVSLYFRLGDLDRDYFANKIGTDMPKPMKVKAKKPKKIKESKETTEKTEQ